MSIPFILPPDKKEPAAARLRAMLKDGKVRIVPELYDCLSAKAAEMNGFEVIMVSSGDLACGMTGIYLFFHSPFATVLKGSRDNLERLTFVGMNTTRVRLFACMVSSFFVTVAGILYAMRNMGAFPVMFSTNTSTEGLIMCLIGGMYSFYGPILGAAIVTFISTQVSIATKYYLFILGAIIVLCVLFLQNGILRDKNVKNLGEIPKKDGKEAEV